MLARRTVLLSLVAMATGCAPDASADAYRNGLTGFLGPGTTNARAFARIFASLPSQPREGGAGM